jgi:phage tail protein X
MMSSISLSSRYQRNRVGTVVSRNGVPRQAILHRYPTPLLVQVVEHLWTSFDSIDILAARYYGNESSWWMIAEANPRILDWTSIPVGTIVRIPNVA